MLTVARASGAQEEFRVQMSWRCMVFWAPATPPRARTPQTQRRFAGDGSGEGGVDAWAAQVIQSTMAAAVAGVDANDMGAMD